MSGFLHEVRANGLVTRIAAIAAIGGFLFGYDTGVISGALLFIKKDLQAGPVVQEFIVSALLVGAIVGAVASGWSADRFGRRNTKIVSGCVYVVGALGCAFAVNSEMLIGFRLLLGFSVGTASFVSPMYISEVSPPRIRGGLTSFNQLAITTGILTAYLVDYFFRDLPGNWRWMVGVAALPGAALAIGMLTVPKTPRWLVEHGRDDQARRVLEQLREGADGDAKQELEDIRHGVTESRGAGLRDLTRRQIRPLLLIGCALAVFQQFVGTNTVVYYAPTILEDTGLKADAAIGQTLAVGLTNLVFTVVAVLLLDRVGRRPLLLTGTAVLTCALVALAVYFASDTVAQAVPWLALVALVVYMAGFAVGLGPVFWLMISEIFPQSLRSLGMSVSTVANWTANFAISVSFLSLVGAITRPGTFLLYAILAVTALLFFAARVPETKQRSLEEIQRELQPR
ncbi:sugar porter family MFS transporter [Streptomyces sp. NPDC006265]|uniref:sugar porter family MFS transporter n=1 Tax=Streptomyces sp. NPDC006265 TaxID=3156740 RepID=UPI0033BB530C